MLSRAPVYWSLPYTLKYWAHSYSSGNQLQQHRRNMQLSCYDTENNIQWFGMFKSLFGHLHCLTYTTGVTESSHAQAALLLTADAICSTAHVLTLENTRNLTPFVIQFDYDFLLCQTIPETQRHSPPFIICPSCSWIATPKPPILTGAEFSFVARRTQCGLISRWIMSFSWQ